jgi:UDP-3-O-[3-hydroxymyristoyl] glucosamine N-acyltransferase
MANIHSTAVVDADVQLADDVTIGPFCVVEKGVSIGSGTILANNVVIGENTAIAGLCAIAGSTVFGRNVQMGGMSGSAGHLIIGDNASVAGHSTVLKDVPPGTFYMGHVAMPHKEWKRMHAAQLHLPELVRKVAELERTIEKLKQEG